MKTKNVKPVVLQPAANGILVRHQIGPERQGTLIANTDMHVFNDKADLFDWLMEYFEDTN